MDAKQLGAFIAERRKELGLTQALLAEQLHVTDKAISRWERGVGLPDIGNIEALAAALEVSLIELLQAQRSEEEHMSTKEAEKLLLDTIQLSKVPNKSARNIGCAVLALFAVTALMVLSELFSSPNMLVFSVASIIAGLIACGIPIWQATIAQTSGTVISTASSFGFALLTLLFQFMNIASEIHTGDIVAVEDTIDGLVSVVLKFIVAIFILNTFTAFKAKLSRRK
ncbi:MAG: helix-turn-helix domain-containing protein [Oscillospiraceae bacterium]